MLAVLCVVNTGAAAPFVPSKDSEVLESVPYPEATRALQPLRRQLADHPDDLDSALSLATAYLKLGHDNADPRFTSYAQATLARWLALPEPPPSVLVLEATALQSLHRFPEALELLDRALKQKPNNAQAWLAKATILQVQGRFDTARLACGHLVQAADQTIALVCLASVNALTGRLSESYHTLSSAFQNAARYPPAFRLWVATLCGEMAERLGDARTAERHFKTALTVAPDDIYTRSAYADLLLRENRAAEVEQLLAAHEPQEVLLLRLAIAGRSTANESWARMLAERFAFARNVGDMTHLREQARFELQVRNEPHKALALAEQNWQVQKEPADVRVYLQAALAAHSESGVRTVREWMSRVNYEDRAIDALLAHADWQARR